MDTTEPVSGALATWSPADYPAATRGPSIYSGPLSQLKSCLCPYRHLKHFRRLRPNEPRSPRNVHFPEEAVDHYRPFSPTDPSDYVQNWYHHFNPYRLFRTLPPRCWKRNKPRRRVDTLWEPDDPIYEPLHQRLMLEFYRLQQLAHQKGLLLGKHRYRVIPKPPTPKVDGSQDLS